MKTTAIILAAGQGKRMNAGKNKQFLMVNDKPILTYTMEAFISTKLVDDIILVVNPRERDEINKGIIEPYFKGESISIRICDGGSERYNSVYKGLMMVDNETEYVLIHDGARPLVSYKEISDSINHLKNNTACVLGVKAINTYKLVDENKKVMSTVPRERLYSILTPQSFHKDIIVNAYKKGIEFPKGITDDGMMVEKFSDESVYIVEGSYENIKITTPEDLITMENILNNHSK